MSNSKRLSEMSDLDLMVRDCEQKVDRMTEQVVNEARRLSEHLAKVADNVAAGWSPNSLGEVQGRGVDVDRACVLLNAAAESLTIARHVRDRMQGEAV